MRLDQTIIAQLNAAAAVATNLEICGALVGRDERVTSLVDVANQSTTPHSSFLIPARAVLDIERAADANGDSLLGFYHSHPRGNAVPSERDLEQALPGYVYVILARGEARAWQLRADRSGFDEMRYDDD